jgi:hypothetical protein
MTAALFLLLSLFCLFRGAALAPWYEGLVLDVPSGGPAESPILPAPEVLAAMDPDDRFPAVLSFLYVQAHKSYKVVLDVYKSLPRDLFDDSNLLHLYRNL